MIRFNFFEQNSRISLGRKQHYAACMPVKLFSRSASPPDLKILFPSTEQTTSLPASLALSENEKPPKQKLFCDCGQYPHDTGLLFANFQGVLRSASWSTSQPIFFLSNSSGLWGLIGGARDRFKQSRDRFKRHRESIGKTRERWSGRQHGQAPHRRAEHHGISHAILLK